MRAFISDACQLVFGTLEHSLHRRRRDAVKTLASKRTIRLAETSLQDITGELCTKLRDLSTTRETFEVFLPYLAWSTDIAALYLEDRRRGLLKDEQQTRAWAQALNSVVELIPIQKQIPLFTPLVFSLPEWLIRKVSPTLHCFVETHKVHPKPLDTLERLTVRS